MRVRPAGYETAFRWEREAVSQPYGHTQNTLRAYAKSYNSIRKKDVSIFSVWMVANRLIKHVNSEHTTEKSLLQILSFHKFIVTLPRYLKVPWLRLAEMLA